MEGEEFKMTPEELATFNEACKSSEFKELFFSYLKELEDPANKKLYEEEIQKLELEKGNVVEFVKPVFVKAFQFEKYIINVCKGNVKEYELNDIKYKIPFCLNIVKQEIVQDKEYKVYSISFHENTIRDLDYFTIAKEEIENITKAKLKFIKECNQAGQIENSITKTSTKKSNKIETSIEFIEKTLKQQQKNKEKKDVIPEFKLTYIQINDGYQAYTPTKNVYNTHLKIEIKLNIDSINNIELDLDQDGLLLRGCGYGLALKFKEDLDYDNAEAVFVKSSKLLAITAKILYPAQKAEVFEGLEGKEKAEINDVGKVQEYGLEECNDVGKAQEYDLGECNDVGKAQEYDLGEFNDVGKAQEYDLGECNDVGKAQEYDLEEIIEEVPKIKEIDAKNLVEEINSKVEQLALDVDLTPKEHVDATNSVVADLTPKKMIDHFIPIIKSSQTLKSATIVIETPEILPESFTHTNLKQLLLKYKTSKDECSICLEIDHKYRYEIDVGVHNVIIKFVKTTEVYWDNFLVNGKSFGFMILRDEKMKVCDGKVIEKVFVKDGVVKVEVNVGGEKLDLKGKGVKETIFVNDLLFDLD